MMTVQQEFEEWLDALEQDLGQPGGTEERIAATDMLFACFLWWTSSPHTRVTS